MTVKPETILVRECLAWVKQNGGNAYHVHGSTMQRSGEPDIDGAIPVGDGIVHFKIECKVGDNRPTKLQLKRLRDWALLGYTTGVAYSVEEFIKIIKGGRKLYETKK